MSKYQKLWDYLQNTCLSTESLSFNEIYRICGASVDSSFMMHKSELEDYGLSVVKIDLRNERVMFTRNAPGSGRRRR